MENLILTKENLKEWKLKLDQKMYDLCSIFNYSECVSDDEWLSDMEGYSVSEAVDIEIDSWSDGI